MKPSLLLLASLLPLLTTLPVWAQTPIESEPLEPTPAVAPVAASPRDDLAQLEQRAEKSFEEDDLDTAIVLYGQLRERVTSGSERARVMTTIAWLEHLSGRDLAAAETLTRALLEHPNQPLRAELYSEDFAKLFYDAQKRAREQRETTANERLVAGTAALRRGDYPTARAALDEALAAQPDHPTALYNRALVDYYQNHLEDALAGFQKVLSLQASNPPVTPQIRALALSNIGLLYYSRGLLQEAEKALAEAVTLDAKNGSAWTNLGATRRQLGQQLPAAEAFRKAWEITPNDPTVVNNLALAYLDAKEWVLAAGLLADAAQRFPNDPKLWLNLGRAQEGMGNTTGAVTSFESAIRADPANAAGIASTAAVDLARFFYESGDIARSLEQAQRAIGLRSDLPDAWIFLGLAQKAKKDLAGARQSFEQARKLDPTRAETYNNLGSVYFELKELDLAEEAFGRALGIQPGLTEAQDNLEAVRRSRDQTLIGRAQLPGVQTPTTPPPPSAAARPTLGLRFSNADYAALGLKGAMVESVEAGSLADRAGLRSNDLILKVDGRDVASGEALLRYLQSAGSSVTLDLLRDNRPQRLEMRVR